MKKSVSTSLALVALALVAAGGIALLGGPNVLTVLSNIKPPSKTKTEETPVEEKASETKVEELKPKEPDVQKVQTKKVEEVVKPAPISEPQKEVQKIQKPKFKAPEIPENATKKVDLDNGKYALVFPRGERVEYNEHGIPVWSSWEGRLIDKQEEKDYWLNRRGSSGSEGKAFWCVTPSGTYNVEKFEDCLKFSS